MRLRYLGITLVFGYGRGGGARWRGIGIARWMETLSAGYGPTTRALLCKEGYMAITVDTCDWLMKLYTREAYLRPGPRFSLSLFALFSLWC